MINETTTLWCSLKSKFGLLFGSAFALLAPIQFILLLVGCFIVMDTIFGVYASKKLGKEFTSRKFSKFISKMFVYNAVIIMTYALDVQLLGEFFMMIVSVPLVLTKVTAIALVVNEIISIDEKLKMIKKGKGIWFHFKRLLSITKLIKKQADELDDTDSGFGSEGLSEGPSTK